MFHSGVMLYYYRPIDVVRNIVYSRTHIQIVKQHDKIYYALYIVYSTYHYIRAETLQIYEYEFPVISFNVVYIYTTSTITLFLNGFVDRVLDFKH